MPPKIVFPDLTDWERIDSKAARAKDAERIAPVDFEERIERFQNGEDVDLSGDGRLRIGCSLGLLVDGKLVFGSFDTTHPSRPGYLTPAAGVFEGDCMPHTKAAMELAEEFILLDETNRSVGIWQFGGLPIYPERAKEYAEAFGCRFDPELVVRARFRSNLPNVTKVRVGEAEYGCLVEYEADTSSIELIFVAGTTLPEGVSIVDGERLPNGDWRRTPVIRWTPECTSPLTTKAEILIATFGTPATS